MFRASLRLAILLVLLCSCAMESHQHLYGKKKNTQVGFFYEKGRHLTTNYLKGTYVPAGTAVTLTSVKGTTVFLDIDGTKVNLVNVSKYSGLNMDQLLDRYLTDSVVVSNNINKASIGMSKSEVIKAIGYPPSHVTVSTDLNEWVYWKSRFNREKLIFTNGNLSEIID